MPVDIFKMDKRDLKKLERFFKKSPKLFRSVTANILNSLAYTTKKYDIINISNSMIIRDRNFLEKKSLKVLQARKTNIEQQIAIVGSIKKARFTGWKEQQTGKRDIRRRGPTRYARGGSKRGKMIGKARLFKSRQLYKPESFQGRSYSQRYYFMMRVLRSRGGGEFMITRTTPLSHGKLEPGIFGLEGRQVKKYQFTKTAQPRRVQWRTLSLRRLMTQNNIRTVYQSSLRYIINKYK